MKLSISICSLILLTLMLQRVSIAKESVAPTIGDLQAAVQHLFAYRLKGTGVVDQGRDASTRFFCRELPAKDLAAAIGALRKMTQRVGAAYRRAVAPYPYPDFLKGPEKALLAARRQRDASLTQYRLVDWIARLQSLEETVRRLEELEKRNSKKADAYRKLIRGMNLVTIPAGITFFIRHHDATELARIMHRAKPVSTTPMEQTEPLSYFEASARVLTAGAGWTTRTRSTLVQVGEFERPLRRPHGGITKKYVPTIRGQIKAKAEELTGGLVLGEDVDAIDDVTWAQACRGPHNQRLTVYGDARHIEFDDFSVGWAVAKKVARLGRRIGPYLSTKDHRKEFPKDMSAYGLVATAGNIGEFVLPVPDLFVVPEQRVVTGSDQSPVRVKDPFKKFPFLSRSAGICRGAAADSMFQAAWLRLRSQDNVENVVMRVVICYRAGIKAGLDEHPCATKTSRAAVQWPAE